MNEEKRFWIIIGILLLITVMWGVIMFLEINHG